MKVLFVSSGNSEYFGVTPFIKSQKESLVKLGLEVGYFLVKEKGLRGYIEAAKKLREHLKTNPVDLIHAHYILSGWTCVLSLTNVPIVLSLMGSDAYGDYTGESKIAFKSRYLTFLTLLIQPFVKAIISKSYNINKYVYRKKIAWIIPNGIQIEKFQSNSAGYKNELGLKEDKKYILYLNDKNNIRKNFQLAEKAIELIGNDNVELLTPYPVPHEDVNKYLNSVNVFIHTAFMEGSPNLIKEAMACNCPIVSTNVGDISWIFGETKGCHISTFSPGDVAEKVKAALIFGKRTNGRQRIKELGLDSETVAKKIVKVYERVIGKRTVQ